MKGIKIKRHKCNECGLIYNDKNIAKKCQEWCNEHKSCNLEITKYAINKKEVKIKVVDKLSVKRVSLSLAYVTAIVSIVCALLLAIFPEGSMSLLGSIFHGLDISQIAVAITWSSAILGTVAAIVLALAIGCLFAKIYNSIRE